MAIQRTQRGHGAPVWSRTMSMSNARMDRGPRGSAHSFSEEAGHLIERQIRSQYPISLDIVTKYCTLVHPKTTGRLKPNVGSQPRPEAEARHERTLEGVGSMPLFGQGP